MRTPLVAANWKMNGSREAADAWLREVLPALSAINSDTLLCAPYVYLPQLADKLMGTKLMLGAQNVSHEKKGAFTGEISASMLFDIGVRWCIIGHSERRSLYGETDAIVAQKALRLTEVGLKPVLCIGETLQERREGHTLDVVLRQLCAVLDVVGAEALGAIAYEPVWAIGTGQVATPDEAQAVHAAVRAALGERNSDVAHRIPVLYGGSVKPENAAAIFAKPDIDGGLLGGAGLLAQDYLAVCRASIL